MALLNVEYSWLKQPWESDKLFNLFNKYYLPQKISPRSLVLAYHEFLINEKNMSPEEANKKIVPGNWQRYYQAKDSYGRVIYGALTWEERAQAYDSVKEEIKDEAIQTQKLTVLDDELRDYHLQLTAWNELLASLVAKIQREKILKGDRFDPARHTATLDRIVKIRENIAIFGRRTAGMPASIKEERLADADGKKFEIQWKEPFEDEEEIGLGGEIIKAIIKKQEQQIYE